MVFARNLQNCGKCSCVFIDSMPYLFGNLLSAKSPRVSNKGEERTCWFTSKIATSFLVMKSSKFLSIVLTSVSILIRLRPEGLLVSTMRKFFFLVRSYVPDSSEEESCDRVLRISSFVQYTYLVTDDCEEISVFEKLRGRHLLLIVIYRQRRTEVLTLKTSESLFLDRPASLHRWTALTRISDFTNKKKSESRVFSSFLPSLLKIHSHVFLSD
jgi:hypothetical protein